MNLSKDELTHIKAFVENEPMREVVKRVLLAQMYEQGGVTSFDKNFIFSLDEKQDDAEYGRQAKSIVRALVIIENAFLELARHARGNPQATPRNEAR